ncbi:MAG: response regulator [Chloroflexaceae bacterium]|nr:response regulator [Chloroflexaceae bacterium]
MEHGFFPTIESYLQRYQQIYAIHTMLTVPPAVRQVSLPPVVEAHLIRIIQEALSNVRKHAGASLVTLSFELLGERVRLSIVDNGRGFDLFAHAGETAQGYGLRSMHERIGEIEGTLDIQTQLGMGTQISIVFPLQTSDSQQTTQARVLLVDDQPLFLEGLYNMLTTRGITVVGTASNGHEALLQTRQFSPDIILMDVEMPVCNGLEATRHIKAEFPETHIVMLTVSAQDDYLFEAMKSGASGYLLKNMELSEFFSLLAGLQRGELALSADMAHKMLREFARPYQAETAVSTSHDMSPGLASTSEVASYLSDLERAVLTLAAQGHTYRAVGEQVGYSERTIKKVMSTIMKKLHLKNRAEAIAYARKVGLDTTSSNY